MNKTSSSEGEVVLILQSVNAVLGCIESSLCLFAKSGIGGVSA